MLLSLLNKQVFLPAYICVCYVSAWCLVVSSRIPVTDSYESPCGSLKEHPVLLTAEPLLQTQTQKNKNKVYILNTTTVRHKTFFEIDSHKAGQAIQSHTVTVYQWTHSNPPEYWNYKVHSTTLLKLFNMSSRHTSVGNSFLGQPFMLFKDKDLSV